jgi:hypothetical protein
VDDESDWQRQVLVGVLVLVVVGAVVGGIVALVTIKAADLAGIDDTAANTGLPHDRRDGGSGGPSGDSSSPATTGAASTGSGDPTTSTGSTQSSGPTQSTQDGDRGLTLVASPLSVAASERIDLDGSCRAVPSGALLQVQRREGGHWADFPVSATCSDGSYSTYILTGHTGPNHLRMLAIGLGTTSNTVVVEVS